MLCEFVKSKPRLISGKLANEPRKMPRMTGMRFSGTPQGQFVSMGVVSDGSYGAPKDVVFSFPVTISAQGQWSIVQGLSIDDFARKMLDATGKELEEERAEAISIIEA